MYTPEPKKPLFERIQERLAASRFLTFSALLHAILIFLGGGVVLYKQATDVRGLSPPRSGDLVASDTAGASAAGAAAGTSSQQQEFWYRRRRNSTRPQLSAIISTTNVTTPTFQVAAAMPVMSAPVERFHEEGPGQNAAKNVGNTAWPAAISAGHHGQDAAWAAPGAPQKAMQMNGGKKESEEAVMRGLRWLVKTQNSDGSWGVEKLGPNFTSAMTGFAILSFLGHGETPVSAEFGPTVQKALDWVLTNGKKNDGHLCMTPMFSQQGVYAHAIVAYALGEYYTMTKDERVVDLLKKADAYIVDGQGPDDGGC